MKIIFNNEITDSHKNKILEALKNNNGYCPCRLDKNEDTRCICKEFREQTEGICHCGLYKKVKN